MQLSDIAIVILNWNGRKLLEQFLPTVLEHSKGARIYVADNASVDDSIAFLKSSFPEIHILQNTSNGGFAKGYNDALKHVNEKLYLLLNSDVEVTENWLLPLLEEISQENVVGVQPKILAQRNKTHFEHAGASGGFIDRDFYPFCRGRLFDIVEEDKGQYDYPMEVFWTSGACMLIRREIYWKVGGLDEDFFAHMEEIDMCWRIKKLGYSLRVVPASVVYHVGGGTLDYQSPHKTFLNFRNSLFMITKNYDGWLFGKIFKRLILDGISGVLYFVKGKFKLTFAIVKAHFAFYQSFGKILAKRKQIQSHVSFKEIKGVYKGSVVGAKFIKGIQQFSKLNLRKLE